MSAFLEGAVAGYGIAIPVGAIAVLLVDLALRRGFAPAAAAAAGVATADLVYATVAVLLGAAVADVVEPYQDTLRVVSAFALLLIAAHLLRGVLAARRPVSEVRTVDAPTEAAYFARFLGLTILNPATITYFVALILGLDRGDASAADKVRFVAGAFLASLSWQLVLAALGSVLHRRLPENARTVLGIAGVMVITGFAVRLALSG
ncbi:MAG: LysE family transporter [Actinomycetota bacterium]|nr:LysE family transporter [Actinomycetota bacterium]